MNTVDAILITQKGWQQLQQELVRLREQHDSRTAEYTNNLLDLEPGDAGLRYLQGEVSTAGRRVAQLEEVLSRAIPVDSSSLEPGVVGVGSTVVVRWEDGDEEKYEVVGPPEVDLRSNRISYESPVGRALTGRRKGQWVEAETPGGTSRLEILLVQ